MWIVKGLVVDTTISETTKVSVECLDCRTWGTTTAERNTDHDLRAYLHFAKVGGYFDFGLAASSQGTYVFQLHSGVGDKSNITVGADFLLSELQQSRLTPGNKPGWHLDMG